MKTNVKKPFLVIGTFQNSKIINELQLSGRKIISKNLTSSPHNWDVIISMLKKRDRYHYVLLSLSEAVLMIAQCEGYIEKFREIICCLENHPHIIFLYEDNLFGKFNIFRKKFYLKYLYYDQFFESREIYWKLQKKMGEDIDAMEFSIAEKYLKEMLLPAVILADTNIWREIWESSHYAINKYSFLGEEERKQNIDLSTLFNGVDIEEEVLEEDGSDEDEDWIPNPVLDDDYYELIENSNPYISELRKQLYLGDEEKTLFFEQSIQEQIEYLEKMEGKAYFNVRINRQNTLFDGELLARQKEISELLSDFTFVQSLNTAHVWKKYHSFRKDEIVKNDEHIRNAQSKMELLISELQNDKLNLCSFRYSNDEVLAIRQLVEAEDHPVVFKRYILKDQIFADEFERFLKLFQEYLSVIKKINVTFEEQLADIGTVYVLRAHDKETKPEHVAEYGIEFLKFLEICDSDIEEARVILSKMGCSDTDYYLKKYIKELSRLKIDIRHDYERKLLEIRQSMENEIIEEKTTRKLKALMEPIEKLPELGTVVRYLDNGNFDIIEMSEAPQIFGDPQLNEKDKLLIKYLNRLEGRELTTELQILKDQKAQMNDRKNAGIILKRFLSRNAQKIGSLDFEECNKYIDEMMNSGDGVDSSY